MEVTTASLNEMKKITLGDKNSETAFHEKKIEGECAKKAFLLYVQSWLIRDAVNDAIKTCEDETAHTADKKEYIQKARETIMSMKRCEVQNLISGYQEGRAWNDWHTSYVIRGNHGCEDLFRKMVEISRIAKIWELHDGEQHLRIVKQDGDFHQLTRRFGRYKRARMEALKAIRDERTKENKPDTYVDWETVHARVEMTRNASGYDSEQEEQIFREKKGKGKGSDYQIKQTAAKGG